MYKRLYMHVRLCTCMYKTFCTWVKMLLHMRKFSAHACAGLFAQVQDGLYLHVHSVYLHVHNLYMYMHVQDLYVQEGTCTWVCDYAHGHLSLAHAWVFMP